MNYQLKMLLFVFVSQILYFNYLIMDTLNSKHRKQQWFLKTIMMLKTHLKLKYYEA